MTTFDQGIAWAIRPPGKQRARSGGVWIAGAGGDGVTARLRAALATTGETTATALATATGTPVKAVAAFLSEEARHGRATKRGHNPTRYSPRLERPVSVVEC